MKGNILLSILVIAVLILFTTVAWADESTGDSTTSISSYVKWSQLPDMSCGVNIESIEDDRQEIVADDWRCLDPRPVTDVHFWGSYIGWEKNIPPKYGVEGFVIRIYKDVPATAQYYSHPEEENIYEEIIYIFKEEHYATIVLPDDSIEQKFYYSLDLPVPFEQEEETIYWISIAAIMPNEYEHPWGWETCDPEFNWNDNACKYFFPGWAEISPGSGILPDWYCHETVDMAFELTVGSVPPPPLEPVKWQHRPDMAHGINVISIVSDDPLAPNVAEDWLCLDGSPISDIHFWGSYPGWYPNEIPPFPNNPPGVNEFRIRIYSDEPATPDDFSHPKELLYEVFVDDFNETYVASILQDEVYEHKYKYDLDLIRFFRQKRGTIYWLSIAAIPRNNEYPWGWESSIDRWNDFAVQSLNMEPDKWKLIEHPYTKYTNMAFELTTCEGPIKWLQFPDMADGRNILSLPMDPVVADDWLCTDGMPITEVHFWGSYLSWDEEVHWEQYNSGSPNGLPEPPGVEVFKLSFHEDIPAGVDPNIPWSRPGELIRDVWVDYSAVNEQYWDSVPHMGPDGTTWWEHKFYYIICLDEPFKQEEGTVYWLDIGAKPREDSNWFWGWETSKDHWNDNAVRGWEDGWWWKPIEPYTTEQVDMAFLLTTGKGICGDVDGNGIINILDARLLMNHIANPGAYPVNPCTGNVDGINGIDMHDLVLLLKHIFDPAGNPLNCPGI